MTRAEKQKAGRRKERERVRGASEQEARTVNEREERMTKDINEPYKFKN